MTVPHSTAVAVTSRSAEAHTLAEALASPPCLVVVTGEAGVGKSRLVAAILDEPALRGRTRVTVQCHRSQCATPLAPVVEALSRFPEDILGACGPLTGALVPLLPELSRHLPSPPPPLPDPCSERHRHIRAAEALLRTSGPAVLVVKDVQDADPSTRELLRRLAATPPSRLSVVVTTRDGGDIRTGSEAAFWGEPLWGETVREVRLRPFTPEETGRFAAHLLDVGTVSDDFAQRLHRRTAGLPFAIEEVLRSPSRQDDTYEPGTDSPDEGALPGRVRRALLERLGRLPRYVRHVVSAAAVVPMPATVDLLAEVAGLAEPEVRRALSRALAHGVLHPGPVGTYEFRHSLDRQAAYEAIPEPERPVLHLRTARALRCHAVPPPLERIADHYRQAGRTEQWLRYTETAGNRAYEAGDWPTATELFLAAARGHSRPGARVRLALKLGRAATAALPHEDVVATLRRVVGEDAPSPVARGELRLHIGVLLRRLPGRGSDGLAEIVAAVPDLERTAPALAARAMATAALPSLQGRPVEEHLRWLERARRLAVHVDDPAARAAIAADHLSALTTAGREGARRSAAGLPESAASPAEEAQWVRARVALAYATTALGHPEAAGRHLAGVTEMLRRNKFPYLEGAARNARLLLAWSSGDWDGLADRAAHAADRHAGIPAPAAGAHLVRGLLALHVRGDSAHAREDLLSAARTAPYDASLVTTVAAAALARIHLAADRPDQAWDELADVLACIRRTGGWVWAADIAPVAVEALSRSGLRGQAASLTRELDEGIKGRDAPSARAALLTCRALTAGAWGCDERADETFAAAEYAWRTAGRPFDAARARELRGIGALPAEPEQGERDLSAAIDAYRLIDARWDAKRCERQLRRHGFVVRKRRGSLGYGDELSPREEAVARLVARGGSNREVAAHLHLSHRTVEHHVSSVMRKLGLASRAEFGAHVHGPASEPPGGQQ